MERDQAQKRKEMLISLMEEDTYVPMRRRELAVLLSVPSEERRVFHEILDELVSEGQVEVSKRGKYSRARHRQVVGQFMATSRGFGFVAVDGMEEDIFIPEHAVGVAMHGDTVAVRLEQGRRGKRPEGVIEKVLIHAVHQVVGTYDASKKFGFVIPDNAKYGRDLFIPKEYDLGAVSGHKVVAEITDYGSEDKNPEGRIVEIIGHVNDPGVDIISIVRAYGLPDEFSDEVLRAAAKTPEQLAPEDYSGRKDLRDLQTVTIDGEDAKDLDDAITISRSENGFVLGVHIADVSHYVRENSPLDREARKRGTSVYLVDRVIPMLPHRLSNGICSLNAGCDRLALSCMMEIDDKGIVTGHEICESVIRVDERMSYTSVRKILQDHDASECARYEKLVPMFQDMEQLAAILQKKRRKRGFIDFDFPETKIVLDEKGHPVSVAPYERNVATKIIEDFMLAANETVAEEFFWREVPFVYRTHETPDAEKMARLEVLISNFGYYIKNTKESIHPKELQKLLEKIEDTPEEALISRLVLRSMKRACYTTECTGHFGLATKYYCHFTSPIRRYPDLQIHRIIKECIHGQMSERRSVHYERILSEVAAHSSATERRADEAERETLKLKKVEYMQDRIGQIYDGIISGMTNWGMYVELPNTVEGLIRVQSMEEDYYFFDEEHFEFVGESSKKIYKLGQPVTVQVKECDYVQRIVEFALYDRGEEADHGKDEQCKADCKQ